MQGQAQGQAQECKTSVLQRQMQKQEQGQLTGAAIFPVKSRKEGKLRTQERKTSVLQGQMQMQLAGAPKKSPLRPTIWLLLPLPLLPRLPLSLFPATGLSPAFVFSTSPASTPGPWPPC